MILRLCDLGPCHPDDTERGEQGLLVCYEDIHLHGLPPHVRLAVQCCPQSTCMRHEHDDIIHAYTRSPHIGRVILR